MVPDEGPTVVLTAFDHLVVAVRDLERASEAFRRLGFDVRPGGRNPGAGTHNAIIRFGIDYIELLSLEDAALALEMAPAGRALASYLATREGGAAAWVAQSDDVEEDAARAERDGFSDIGRPIAMRRARPDGTEFAWQLLIPRGLALRQVWPLLIQWQTSDAERLSAEPVGDHANGALGIRELSVVLPSIEVATTEYGRRLGLPLGPADVAADIGATSVRTRVGDLTLKIWTPTGPGPIATELASHGPGPLEVRVTVRDLDATGRLLDDRGVRTTADADGSIAVDPEDACGVRLRFCAADPDDRP